MARKKNALRKHEIQEFSGYDELTGEPTAPTELWLRLGKWITSITDSSADTTEEGGDYAGDGTPSTEVTAVAERWTFTGTYDEENPAQKLIVSKKREIGDARKFWHRITYPNGDVYQGVATSTDPIGGSGEATAFGDFSTVLNFDNTPVKVAPVGG